MTARAKNNRVLFMVAEYNRISGGQQSLLQLVRRLPDAGIEPLVCFPKEGLCSETFREAGVPVVLIPGPPSLTSYGQHLLQRSRWSALIVMLTQMWPYSFRVWREMKRRGISILHCNSVRSLLFAGFAPRVFGAEVIWHVRGQLLPFGRPVKWVAERMATSIILVADALKDQITPRMLAKCRTIHNGIDEQAIPLETPAASCSVPQLHGQQVVTTVAAVTPFKGHHHLITAARLVNKEMPDAKPLFLCVGDLFDKNYVDYLRRQISENELDNFLLLGWQKNPFPFYQLADVVVLPTVERERLDTGDQLIEVRSGEGLPRSILEAMYCGRPTIATAVAGTAEQIVDGDTGYLVPAGDANALAAAMLKVLQSPESSRREMGARAAARVREKFSTANTVRQTANLYRELLTRKTPLPEPAAVMTSSEL